MPKGTGELMKQKPKNGAKTLSRIDGRLPKGGKMPAKMPMPSTVIGSRG